MGRRHQLIRDGERKRRQLQRQIGAEVNGTVATFTDPDSSATASEYSATIEWGDGTSSSGTVSGSGGSFSVSGGHTYADEGTYPIAVKIADVDNPGNTAT